jgi:hypothetical protein
MRLAKGHEIQRHNVPRHRTIHYELVLLDWRRSFALHLCPRSLAFRSRPPRLSRTVPRWCLDIVAGRITLTGNG